MSRKYPDAKILIIDADISRVNPLIELLRMFGFSHIDVHTDSGDAFDKYLEFEADLVVVGLQPEDRATFDLLKEFSQVISRRVYVPVLVVAANDSKEAKELALASGAMDFITQPFNPAELVLRVNNLLHTRELHLDLERENERLESRVRERTRELEEAYTEVLERLALASEYRDDESGSHTQRVGAMAEQIARNMGLPETDCNMIGKAALLHDVGKIGIPDSILLKPGPLTIEEMAIMQRHIDIGAELLSNSRSKLLKLAEIIALTHHERWNGGGYLGLSGEDIPLPGRIVAVADVFDVLLSRRAYKNAWQVSDAIAEIRRGSGMHFDPKVVDAFILLVEDGYLDGYAHPDEEVESLRAVAV